MNETLFSLKERERDLKRKKIEKMELMIDLYGYNYS